MTKKSRGSLQRRGIRRSPHNAKAAAKAAPAKIEKRPFFRVSAWEVGPGMLGPVTSISLALRELDAMSALDAFAEEMLIALAAMADLMELDGAAAGREAFVAMGVRFKELGEAIEGGHPRPLLDLWKRRSANRPPPSRATLELRIITARAAMAFQGFGLDAGVARQKAADITMANSAYGAITKETVGTWEREFKEQRPGDLAKARDIGARSESLEKIEASVREWLKRHHMPLSRWGEQADVRIKEKRASMFRDAMREAAPKPR
ncbi:hypothetical protein IHQ68_13730 [Chelatococcus sambhunathii]|uniref:Uncharacterized protein n=1 Tax=Chelatococcus sambhunathii TaxID=363953 RepID=A0ABU1DI27_9HYPH|nr:hypothetical protein [Chelatococcus sambhunathii]MDR4307678.1 hypothetical protein [Chelatococcus sambhunathii]